MTTLLSLINSWNSLTVLVVGDVMLDRYLHGSAERLCPEAPVPVVTVTEQQDFAGGAANVAANLAQLGAKVMLLSVVGRDEAGDRLRQLAQSHGIRDCVVNSPHRSTLIKQRVVATQHLLVRFDQGSTGAIAPSEEQALIDRLTTLFPQSDAIVISDYAYGILTPRLIQTLAALQAATPRVVVVDAKQLQRYRSLGATAVKPNYNQAVALLNLPKQSIGRRAQILAQQQRLLEETGAAIVAVTLDVEGALVCDRTQWYATTAEPAPTQQTSGAGDTYVSALTLALVADAPAAVAASLAAWATSVVVKQLGTTTCTAADLAELVEASLPVQRIDPCSGGEDRAATPIASSPSPTAIHLPT